MAFRKLVAFAALICAAGFGQTTASRRAPTPLFSAAYVSALDGVLDLEPADAAKLEARLAQNPDDFAARLKLMAYSARADRIALPASRAARANLAIWLINHRPDSEILASPYAIFQPSEITPEQRREMIRLWELALKGRASDAKVQWNAAQFYRPIDPAQYLACLEHAVAMAPENERYSQPLGTLYASSILNAPDSADGRRASAALDSTKSAFLLEAAVRQFHNEYNRSLMLGKGNTPAGDLAQRYFKRAQALDPGLDEAWILPKLEPGMAGLLAPGARPPENRPAPSAIRRLTPDDFPELPRPVQAALRARGCTIPQPWREGAPKNVSRGEFLEKGSEDWAILCSSGGSSSILVFRGGRGDHPEEFAKWDDQNYIQDGSYSREIHAVDRKFILTHYRAYGGPEPPPIDHLGVDDMFLEKASTTYYFYQGKWMQLTGSD